jgi:hypothetical protein
MALFLAESAPDTRPSASSLCSEPALTGSTAGQVVLEGDGDLDRLDDMPETRQDEALSFLLALLEFKVPSARSFPVSKELKICADRDRGIGIDLLSFSIADSTKTESLVSDELVSTVVVDDKYRSELDPVNARREARGLELLEVIEVGDLGKGEGQT